MSKPKQKKRRAKPKRSREVSREISYHGSGAAVATDRMRHSTIMEMTDEDLYVPQGDAGLEDKETLSWYKVPESVRTETLNNIESLRHTLTESRTFKPKAESITDEQRHRDALYVTEMRYIKHPHNIKNERVHDRLPRTTAELIQGCSRPESRFAGLTEAQIEILSTLDSFAAFESSMRRGTRGSFRESLAGFNEQLYARTNMQEFQRQFLRMPRTSDDRSSLHVVSIFKMHEYSRYFACVVLQLEKQTETYRVLGVHGWFYYACGCSSDQSSAAKKCCK